MKWKLVAALSSALAVGTALAAPALSQTVPDGAAATRSRPPRASTAREPTAGQMAARERQRKCGAEWKTAKAGGQTAGLKWPQYWSQCNARLKGNQA